MNNLDKLIQLATIEQMYSMLNKMKSEFNYDELKHTTFSNNCHCSEKMVTNFQDKLDSLEKFTLKRCQELEVQNNDLRQRLLKLEDSFNKQEEKTLQTQVEKGQKLLTEYVKVIVDVEPNKSTVENIIGEPIKLNIEEKQVTIPEVKIEHSIGFDYVPADDDEVEIIEHNFSNKLDVYDVCNEGLDNEENDNGELGIEGLDDEEHDNEAPDYDSVCSFPTSELALKPEEVETNVEEEVEEEEEVVEEEQEETNEDEEEEQKSEDELQSVETEEKQENVVEDKEEEDEEEGEEVFEIEIDDVTYFATDEENGVIYEMTKDGDIGKKVGVIKDGEPVFNI